MDHLINILKFKNMTVFKTKLLTLLLIFIAVILYGQDGTLDSSFGNNGILNLDVGSYDDEGTSLAIQPDGKIIFGGTSQTSEGNKDFVLTRLNENGTVDESFGVSGISTTDIDFSIDRLMSIALRSDGKIISIGQGGQRIFNFAITCHNLDGTLDTNFGNNGRVVTDIDATLDYPSSVVVQEDDKFLVAGGADYPGSGVDEDSDFAIVKYNKDGSLDLSFGQNGIVTTDIADNSLDAIKVIDLQPDGKIIVVGYSGIGNGQETDFAVVRYNADGSLDASFGEEGITTVDFDDNYNLPNDLAIQPDGKIVIAGYSKSSNFLTEFAIVRLNSNGDIDSSFGAEGKQLVSFNSSQLNQANSVAIQEDGKILVSGFSRQDDYNSFSMVRLDSNGQIDPTFGIQGKIITDFNSNSASNDMLIQDDDKIMLGGISSNTISGNNFGLARYIVDLTLNALEPNIKVNQINTYPNPVSHNISLQFYLEDKNHLSLNLMDNTGRILKTYFNEKIHGSGLYKYDLELSDVKSGIYHLALFNGSNSYIKKIIK